MVVALVTEFGRTAHINGNAGTDHGTATTTVCGRRAQGRSRYPDWPSLDANLHHKRDLKTDEDLRSVLKRLLRDHLRVDERPLEATVFLDSTAAQPMQNLLA
jgi:uncharacterized protein (DUF1501 family)